MKFPCYFFVAGDVLPHFPFSSLRLLDSNIIHRILVSMALTSLGNTMPHCDSGPRLRAGTESNRLSGTWKVGSFYLGLDWKMGLQTLSPASGDRDYDSGSTGGTQRSLFDSAPFLRGTQEGF